MLSFALFRGPTISVHLCAGMRDDIARLVQHAEQAQLDAEATVARLKAECDEKVGRLQQEAEAAAVGKAAAEAAAADLGRQLQAAEERLQQAQATSAAQGSMAAAVQAANQGMQHLEGQVAGLQRKLAVRAKFGVGAPVVRQAVAASTRAALLRRENGRLKQQHGELREKVSCKGADLCQGERAVCLIGVGLMCCCPMLCRLALTSSHAGCVAGGHHTPRHAAAEAGQGAGSRCPGWPG